MPKFRDIKKLKITPLLLETMQCSIVKPQRTFRGPLSWKNSKNDKNFQKTWKKNAKISIILHVCIRSTKTCSS